MLYAKNSKGQMVNIIDSIEDEEYYCPICKEKLTRNFGLTKQYYSHKKNSGDNCELKMKLLLKEQELEYNQSDLDILHNEYYNKDFSNVNIEFSDYMSEEGYYLTKEQKDIIFAKEDRIKISALAGSSKSTTLYYYSKERKDKKILYLVYNKSMQLEAEKLYKNIKNVEIRTIHSLAYKYVGYKYRHKLTFNYNAIDIIKDLKLNMKYDIELAVKINKIMQEYMLSNCESFEQLELFKDDKRRNNIILLCERLWELKKDIKSNVKIEHDFYLKLFHLNQHDLSNKYDAILLDECLPESQKIKTDRGLSSIKELYNKYINNKPLPKVLSYNRKKDLFEYKEILSAMKSKNRELLEIKTEGLNKLRCTPNHKILTQRGWIRADKLKVGIDSLILDNIDNQKTKYKPNDDQKQIILGSFLGDGSVTKMSRFNTFRLNFTQGEKQFEYFKSKIQAFNLDYKKIKSGYTGKLSIYQSNNTKVFLLEQNIWKEMQNINPLGLAIWYQDDGSYNGYCVTINSNALTLNQTKYMQTILKDNFNINTSIGKSKNKYYYIKMSRKDSDKFLKIVSPYMHPIMQYKTNIDIINNKINYNNKYLNHGGNYISSVTKIENEDVYDIEVKDNHNFVTARTGKNASGMVVHNCQDSNLLILDVLNNSSVENQVIVGDKFQKIYGFRKAVDITPYFKAKEYKLTTSFRISQQTANLSNLLIQDFDNGTQINMKGFNSKQTIVDEIDKSQPYVCLCRTNAYIFAETIDAIKNGKERLYYEGGYNSYKFNNILDCYNFSIGQKVKNNIFNKFKSYHQMSEYAKETDDIELNSLIKVVDEYGSRIPELISKIKNNTTKDKSNADIIFSTIHRAKGMTCKIPVVISNDHTDLEATFKKLFINKDTSDLDRVKLFEEIALVYVAITRAFNKLQLSDKLKQYLLLRYKFYNDK